MSRHKCLKPFYFSSYIAMDQLRDGITTARYLYEHGLVSKGILEEVHRQYNYAELNPSETGNRNTSKHIAEIIIADIKTNTEPTQSAQTSDQNQDKLNEQIKILQYEKAKEYDRGFSVAMTNVKLKARTPTLQVINIQKLVQLEAENARLTTELTEVTRRLGLTQTQTAQDTAEIQRLILELNGTRQTQLEQLEQLKSQMKQLEETHKEQLEQLKQVNENQIKELKETHKGQLDQIKTANEEQIKQLDEEHKEQLKKVNGAQLKLSSQQPTAQGNNPQNEIEDLQKQLKSAEETVIHIQIQLASINDEKSKLIGQFNKENTKLKAQLTSISEEKFKLVAQFNELKAQLTLIEEEKSKLVKQFNEEKAQLVAAKNDILKISEEKTRSVQELQSTIAGLQANITGLTEQLDEIRAKLIVDRKDQTEANVNDYKNDGEIDDQDVVQLPKEGKQPTLEPDQDQKKLDERLAELNELESKLKAEYQDLLNKFGEQAKQLATLKQLLTENANENTNDVTDKINNMKREIGAIVKVKTDQRSLISAIILLINKCNDLIRTINTQKDDLDDLRHANEQRNRQIEKLGEQLKTQTAIIGVIDKLKTDGILTNITNASDIDTRIRRMNNSAKYAEDYEAENKKADEQILQLKAQIQQLQLEKQAMGQEIKDRKDEIIAQSEDITRQINIAKQQAEQVYKDRITKLEQDIAGLEQKITEMKDDVDRHIMLEGELNKTIQSLTPKTNVIVEKGKTFNMENMSGNITALSNITDASFHPSKLGEPKEKYPDDIDDADKDDMNGVIQTSVDYKIRGGGLNNETFLVLIVVVIVILLLFAIIVPFISSEKVKPLIDISHGPCNSTEPYYSHA